MQQNQTTDQSMTTSYKEKENFERMLNEIRYVIEQKVRDFKEKQANKPTEREIQELQQLALQYRKMVEQKQLDFKDIDQVAQAEKEIFNLNNEKQKLVQDLQNLRLQVAEMSKEKRGIEQQLQIEELRKQILERLQLMREQLSKHKSTLIEQGHQKVVKDLNDQLQSIQKYLSQIDLLEKNALNSIGQELLKRTKECEEDHQKSKQQTISQNQNKLSQIKLLKEQIEKQKQQNEESKNIQNVKEDEIQRLKVQVQELTNYKQDNVRQKDELISKLRQESIDIEQERQGLEELYVEINNDLLKAQRELKQTQAVNSYLYQEKLIVEGFNKANPQATSIKTLTDQIKSKTTQLAQDSKLLSDDWDKRKLRLQTDLQNEIHQINSRQIQKVMIDLERQIKDKENEQLKLKLKLQQLEQQKMKTEQLLTDQDIDKIKKDYEQTLSQYSKLYQQKAELYKQIADNAKELFANNKDFIEKECQQSIKQIEKEINKVKVEKNEEKLRELEGKLQQARELEAQYQEQFYVYDKQIDELSGKLLEREEDINQLEEILEDKDKYIEELKKEVDTKNLLRRQSKSTRSQATLNKTQKPIANSQSKKQITFKQPEEHQIKISPNKQRQTMPLRRLNAGEYLFAGKVINAKVSNGKLFFRTGGGYITFEEFLRLYAKDQVYELVQFAESENLTIEEVLSRFEQHYIEEYYSTTQGGITNLNQKNTMRQKSPQRDIKTQINASTYKDLINRQEQQY